MGHAGCADTAGIFTGWVLCLHFGTVTAPGRLWGGLRGVPRGGQVGVRQKLIGLLPRTLTLSMAAGIGLFLAHIGYQAGEGLGLVVADGATLVTLGAQQCITSPAAKPGSQAPARMHACMHADASRRSPHAACLRAHAPHLGCPACIAGGAAGLH